MQCMQFDWPLEGLLPENSNAATFIRSSSVKRQDRIPSDKVGHGRPTYRRNPSSHQKNSRCIQSILNTRRLASRIKNRSTPSLPALNVLTPLPTSPQHGMKDSGCSMYNHPRVFPRSAPRVISAENLILTHNHPDFRALGLGAPGAHRFTFRWALHPCAISPLTNVPNTSNIPRKV